MATSGIWLLRLCKPVIKLVMVEGNQLSKKLIIKGL